MEQTPDTPPPTKNSKTMLIILAVVTVIAVAAVAVMLFANQSQAPTTTQNEETQTTTPADDTDSSSAADTNQSTTHTATITFTNNGFSPSTLTVKKGTKVTVVNQSSSAVQFSSDDHPTHREDPELNMDELAPGESGSFTVTTVGTHGFHDHIDDSKTGTLIVTE